MLSDRPARRFSLPKACPEMGLWTRRLAAALGVVALPLVGAGVSGPPAAAASTGVRALMGAAGPSLPHIGATKRVALPAAGSVPIPTEAPDPFVPSTKSGSPKDGGRESSRDGDAVLSDNWSGEIATGGEFTTITGDWAVPSVSPSSRPEADADWIGIGGYDITQLIQVGTTSSATHDSTSYSAWYEMLPGAAITLGMPVRPGDEMTALIQETSTNQWYIGIEDLTLGWIVTGTVFYSAGTADSAEWISERPYILTIGGFATLADFGSVRFHNLRVSGSRLTATTVVAVDMENTEGEIIAHPGTVSPTTTSSFTDYYGAAGTASSSSQPPPTVASLSPNTGPPGGGTTVTITGTHLGGAISVSFGSTSATSFKVLSTTRITAVSPAGSGTVNVIVTGPGGTSTASRNDTFTFAEPVTYTRIYGATADGTAAAELEHQFPYAQGICPGTTGTRPVILATDATYPDALSSSYLARYLSTGTLLTPTGSLSAAALMAIHDEGITKVYVVGGHGAIDTGVVDEIERTAIDDCGGGVDTGLGDIEVVRIAGTTEYTTAAKVAEAPPSSNIGSAAFAAAYTGISTGGRGLYNESTGLASVVPPSSTALRTAIVSTGTSYQDAEAASTIAYADSFPILLTTPRELSPRVSSAVSALGIRQVIVMGGPDAVSDAVVSSLESLGVYVLRIAGATYSATSVELAKFETAPSPEGLGWAGTGSLVVARGNWFTDGLAGAVVGADGPSCTAPQPLVLTLDPTSAGPALDDFLHTAGTVGIGGSKVDTLAILGGADAVATATVSAMEQEL